MYRRLSDLESAEPRESILSIERIISKTSGREPNENDLTEVILCLANEIKRLKDEIKTLKEEQQFIKLYI